MTTVSKFFVSNYFICKWTKFSNQRHRFAGWIKKHMTQLYAVYKGLTLDHNTQIVGKKKEWIKIFHINKKKKTKRTGVLVLISDRKTLNQKSLQEIKYILY